VCRLPDKLLDKSGGRRNFLTLVFTLVESQDQGDSARDVNLQVVLAVVPFHGLREEVAVLINAAVPAELLRVRVQDDLVFSGDINTDSVVCVGIGCVEVEDEQQSGTLEDDHLVILAFEADIRLRACEPLVLRLEVLHGTIKVVKFVVMEMLSVWCDEVELTAGIVE